MVGGDTNHADTNHGDTNYGGNQLCTIMAAIPWISF